MRGYILAALTLGLLVTAGCGDDGETTSPDTSSASDGTGSDETGSGETGDDPEATGEGGDAVEVPSDFAIPTVDGAVLVIDSLPGIPDGAYLQLLYPADRYDELVQFYEAWIGEQSAEWSPTPADTSAGVIWFSLAVEGEPGFGQSVTIAPPADSDDRVAVSLVAESVDL